MVRPRIGIFDLACCEGCQLQIINMEEELLELLGLVEPVEWREAISDKHHPEGRFDVALVEGSVTREEDAERLREIRERSDYLIALGSCATLGGVNKLKNLFGIDEVKQWVYGEAASMPQLDTAPVKALHELVQVDHELHGCPIEARELVQVIQSLLVGKKPHVPLPVRVRRDLSGAADPRGLQLTLSERGLVVLRLPGICQRSQRAGSEGDHGPLRQDRRGSAEQAGAVQHR